MGALQKKMDGEILRPSSGAIWAFVLFVATRWHRVRLKAVFNIRSEDMARSR